MKVTWAGKVREFHDGAGLCSPGRWHPSNRHPCGSSLARDLRAALEGLLRKKFSNHARLVFQLACGQCQTSPFDEATIQEARDLWLGLLEARGLPPAPLRKIPEN